MDIVVKPFSGRLKHYAAVFGAIGALVVATIVPAFASADQLTSRSIDLSSASAGASAVTYKINFTAVNGAGAVLVEFCTDSAVTDDATCAAPTGFDISSGTIASGATVDTTHTTANKLFATSTITAGATSIEVANVTNPTSAGTVYARVLTFDTDAHAVAYNPPTTTTGLADTGSVALDFVNKVNVSASVQETMTFCVSGTNNLTTDASCTSATAPNVKLGETQGNSLALDSGHISTGSVYTHISTNAKTGAVVSLKSSADGCGGLMLAGDASDCYIPPTQATDLVAGTAGFGVKTGSATVGTGTYQPVTGSHYNASTYALNYNNTTSGVTSVYGDPFLDTNSLPINNGNMPLTFGATVSNLTPAGNYSADLSLIATGTF